MGVVVAGEIFGLHSLLRDPVHKFRCDAFTDCVVGQIQAREFCEAVARVPFDSFKSIIEMSLGRWWWGLPVWYSRMTRLSVRDRTMAVLLELSRQFGVADSRGMIINLRLRGDDLAELIGASRQTRQPGDRGSGSSWKGHPRWAALACDAEHAERAASRAGPRGGEIVGPRDPNHSQLGWLSQ